MNNPIPYGMPVLNLQQPGGMTTGSKVALGLGIGGSLLTLRSQLMGGNAAKQAGLLSQEAAESQGALADFNAQVADLQAKDAIDRGFEDESRFRSVVRGAIGAQRAGFAAANIDVGFGSAVDVQADAAMLGELDALTIRTNAAREAWGYKVTATDFRKRGEIARKEGAAMAAAGAEQQTASRWGAAATLLGTAGSLLASKYGWGV